MIVFIAGMPRSGSTFSFNIVRDLLRRSGTVHQATCPSVHAAIEQSGSADHVLFKAHTADEATLRLIELGAIKVVCTIRRPEDAVASYMETFEFDLEQSIERIAEWIPMFRRIRDHALIEHYQDIDFHPLQAALRIARHVHPHATIRDVFQSARTNSKKNIKEMFDKLQRDGPNVVDIGFSYYDKNSFCHRRHVSALTSRPAEERIGESAVSCIRERLGMPFTETESIQIHV